VQTTRLRLTAKYLWTGSTVVSYVKLRSIFHVIIRLIRSFPCCIMLFVILQQFSMLIQTSKPSFCHRTHPLPFNDSTKVAYLLLIATTHGLPSHTYWIWWQIMIPLTVRECFSCRICLPRLCHFWKRSSNARDTGETVVICFWAVAPYFRTTTFLVAVLVLSLAVLAIFVRRELKHDVKPICGL
jgi:hypothetical protein